MDAMLDEVRTRLLDRYGLPPTPLARPPLEALLAAVLAQNARPQRVQLAIDNLREAGLLDARSLSRLRPEELADFIQPAGYARLKAGRLRNLMRLVVDRYGGSVDALFAADRPALRAQLLAVNGIGPEIADTILLDAAGQPSFVVELHAHRVVKRHGWIEFEADYHALQEYFEARLPADPRLYRELRALLARLGVEHCGKVPLCDRCPLADLLPPSGPLEPPY